MRQASTAQRRHGNADAMATFYTRYGAVLEAVANYVHSRAARGQRYTPAKQAARWVAHDLPELYRRTFGKAPKPLKAWRVMAMLSAAAYLGAHEAMDVRSLRGKGMTPAVSPRKARLRVIKGGKR